MEFQIKYNTIANKKKITVLVSFLFLFLSSPLMQTRIPLFARTEAFIFPPSFPLPLNSDRKENQTKK